MNNNGIFIINEEEQRICVDKDNIPCANNWNVKSCFGCAIYVGDCAPKRGGKVLPILFTLQLKQDPLKTVKTMETAASVQIKQKEKEIHPPEIITEEKQTIIPEIKPEITHKHSENEKWHKHDLNVELEIEEPCAYCRIPSSGIYKINTLSVCINCYYEICNICNGINIESPTNTFIYYLNK